MLNHNMDSVAWSTDERIGSRGGFERAKRTGQPTVKENPIGRMRIGAVNQFVVDSRALGAVGLRGGQKRSVG